jgi:hypothetical protein
VWNTFARSAGVHEAILSFLDIKPQNFYRMESTDTGKYFVTARGWEDLSRMIQLYEELDLEITTSFVQEFIQFPMVAKDFTSYYTLYRKYQESYPILDIINGNWTEQLKKQSIDAPYEERMMRIHLLLEYLTNHADTHPDELKKQWQYTFQYLENCYGLGLEMQVFMTQLQQSPDTVSFLLEHQVSEYIQYSQWYKEQNLQEQRKQHGQLIFHTLQS